MPNESGRHRRYVRGPACGAETPPHLLTKIYGRLDRAAGDPSTPLGKFLSELPAADALAGLNAVHASLFGEVIAAPPNADAIRERATLIRKQATAARLTPPPAPETGE